MSQVSHVESGSEADGPRFLCVVLSVKLKFNVGDLKLEKYVTIVENSRGEYL